MGMKNWVMSDEWWKLSDQKNKAKQPLKFTVLKKKLGKNKLFIKKIKNINLKSCI